MNITLPRGFGKKLAAFFVLSIVAIVGIPYLDKAFFSGNSTPGAVTLVGIGVTLSLFTGAVLYFGLTTELGFPKQFVLYAFLYNALIVVAKFALTPWAIYKDNYQRAIESEWGRGDPVLFSGMAAVVFLLYFLVFYFLYMTFRERLTPASQQLRSTRKVSTAFSLILLVSLGLLVGIVISSSGLVLLFLYLFASTVTAGEYIGYIFSSGIVGTLIALALVGATAFASAAFHTLTNRAIAVRDATILAAFF